MEETDLNYKIRREKEIRVCSQMNDMSCEEIDRMLWHLERGDEKIITFTWVYGAMLEKVIEKIGLVLSETVLENIRPFKIKLLDVLREKYNNKTLNLYTYPKYKSTI